MTPTFQHIIGMFFTVLVATETWEPARLQSGDLPLQPPMVGGGGEVLLEVGIDNTGRVTEAAVLRSTPPFTAPLREAVLGWRFTPAREAVEDTTRLEAVKSKVLVAAVYRAPTLYDAPARGGASRDEARASEETPFPTTIKPALYPPRAQAYLGQTVLVEAFVDEEGGVTECRVVRSAGGLDAAALDAARQWSFRPARRDGRAVASRAYIVFGFREPVIS